MPINPELFLLPAAIIIGIITSYEDIKEGRIRNKWLLAGFLYSLFVVLVLWDITYLKAYGINLIIAVLASVLIAYAGFWNAADAKLFMVYAALLPLSIYQLGYVPYFPAFSVLINTFTPLAFFFFIVVMFRTSLNEKKAAVISALNPKTVFSIAVFVFAFSWATSYGMNLLGIPQNRFVSLALLFALLVTIRFVLKFDYLILSAAVALLRIVFDFNNILTLAFLGNFLFIMAIVLLIFFLVHLSFAVFSFPVPLSKLKPGMLPAENVVEQNGRFSKQRMVFISIIHGLLRRAGVKSVLENASEGLSKKDIKKLNELHKGGKLNEGFLRVFRTTRFAPFLFAGVVLTLIARGNVFIYLRLALDTLI